MLLSKRRLLKMAARGTPTHRITLDVTDQMKDHLVKYLTYIKKVADTGHSFPIVVDPDDPETRKEFGVDGDGYAHIIDIKVEELGEK